MNKYQIAVNSSFITIHQSNNEWIGFLVMFSGQIINNERNKSDKLPEIIGITILINNINI